MTEKKVIYADLDDMVFENRERSYGAYALRKNYPWHLITALAGVTHLFLLAVCWPFLANYVSEFSLSSSTPQWIKPYAQYMLWPLSTQLFEEAEPEPQKSSHVPNVNDFITVESLPQTQNLEYVRRHIAQELSKDTRSTHQKVLVRVLVDEQGNYQKHLLIFQTHPELGQAVKKHLDKLHFAPAKVGGERVKFWVNVSFSFGS